MSDENEEIENNEEEEGMSNDNANPFSERELDDNNSS